MIIYNGIGFDAWFGKKEQFNNSFLVDISKDLHLIKVGQQHESEKFRTRPST